MSVDLSKAKKGDVVRFRCGGKHAIWEIVTDPDVFGFSFRDGSLLMPFSKTGKFLINTSNGFVEDLVKNPFDIVKVDSK